MATGAPSLTLTVTILDDELDAAGAGRSVADMGGAGDLSLREAIELANDHAGDVLIEFDVGLAGGTITLNPGDGPLVLANCITIDGDTESDGDQDITVSGGDAIRVFEVDDGDPGAANTVALEGLVISNGLSAFGAGIYSAVGDNVTLNNVTVTDNEAFGAGGGILVDGGALTITNSTISNNVTGGNGAGIFAYDATSVVITGSTISGNMGENDGGGFALINSASDTITDTVITGNSADDGGGFGYGGGGYIYGSGGVTLTGVTISNNTAGYTGGGLQLYGVASAQISGSTIDGNSAYDGGGVWISYSSVEVETSTISRNVAQNDGGAFYVRQNTNSSLTLTNSTVAMNVAFDDGGALHLDGVRVGPSGNNTLSLLNSTVTSNYAAQYGGGLYINDATATTSIVNSIVSGNGVGAGGIGTDIYATALPETFSASSIIGTDFIDGAGTATTLGADQSTVSALLFATTSSFIDINGDGTQSLPSEPSLGLLGGVLADNGGAVETVALRTGGLGVDVGDTAAAAGLTTDGRGTGFDRDVGTAVDVGAFESQPAAPIFLGALADFEEAVSIADNAATGTAVIDVDATDGNGGATDENVTFSIIAGNTSSDGDSDLPFAIDSLTGEITVNDTDDLALATGETFTLTVEANNGTATNTATVTVSVTDGGTSTSPTTDTETTDNTDNSASNDDPDAAFLRLVCSNTLSALPDGRILFFTVTCRPPSDFIPNGGNSPVTGNSPGFIVDESGLQSFNGGNGDDGPNIFSNFESFIDDLSLL